MPRARASAEITLKNAEAYRNALIAQSAGKAESFSLQEKAFKKAEELNRTRMILETLEDALAGVPKYIVDSREKGAKSDIWFSMPSLSQRLSTPRGLRKVEPKPDEEKGRMRIADEDDLIDALLRFQQERTGEMK